MFLALTDITLTSKNSICNKNFFRIFFFHLTFVIRRYFRSFFNMFKYLYNDVFYTVLEAGKLVIVKNICWVNQLYSKMMI